MSEISICDGKYFVTNDNGIITVKRHGEDWARNDLVGDGFVLALVQEIEHLRTELSELRSKVEAQAVPAGVIGERNAFIEWHTDFGDEVDSYDYKFDTDSCSFFCGETQRDWATWQARAKLASPPAQAASVPAYYVCKPGTADEQFVAPEAVNGFCGDCTPLYTAQPNESLDAKLGRIAMRFVDRAGDIDPNCDPAERICAEFYKAMSDAIPAPEAPKS